MTHHWCSGALVLWCAVTLAGCGYSTTSLLPSAYKTIAVKPLVNEMDPSKEVTSEAEYRRYQAGLEVDVTHAIKDRFMFDGHLKIAQEEKADVVVEGALIDYIRDPIRTTEAIEVDEYRITIVLRVKVYARATGEVLWESKRFYGDTTYIALGVGAKSEEKALDEAEIDVARRVVERTLEGW